MNCPRCNKNEAIVHPKYGVLPCQSCQDKDNKLPRIKPQPEFISPTKAQRIQNERDLHAGDLEQPFMSNKPNPKFAKIYPDQAKQIFTREELANLE